VLNQVSGKSKKKVSSGRKNNTGKLKIGDNWNAITIIALSQNNPLKAIAEFVENSIDARAKNITIVRGRERGELYLKLIDDGEGIPLNSGGFPNFKYVATHICDSIKKKLKQEGVQGEYGIGLLSFWTVGDRLILSSAGSDGRTYQMEMKKGESGYSIAQRRTLFSHPGTELLIHPLLPGIKQFNGERIQHYLASELRDRIRKSGVKIKIKDRYSRKEFEVKPRQFSGRLLHELDVIETKRGAIYLELYLNNYTPDNTISLFRSGTRVMPSINKFDHFDRVPWNMGYLQGMFDVPFLQLTPGTRDGVVQDESFQLFCNSIQPLEEKLKQIIELEKRAEEEEASRNILKSVQRALKEAFLALPKGEYDWFEIHVGSGNAGGRKKSASLFSDEMNIVEAQIIGEQEKFDRSESLDDTAFYEHAGPLYKAIISPSSCIVRVKESRNFHCIPLDRNRRIVEANIEIQWKIKEGGGTLNCKEGEFVIFTAPGEPITTILQATLIQGETVCNAESIITVTESFLDKIGQNGRSLSRGIPGYTFVRATGELWRSKYDEKNNLIIINNGHKDYIYSSQKKSRKLKYICRLFTKELVLNNFIGFDAESLLERMIELTLYTEEHLH
jgi:hypothetical protein